jgi:hypothetical protein
MEWLKYSSALSFFCKLARLCHVKRTGGPRDGEVITWWWWWISTQSFDVSSNVKVTIFAVICPYARYHNFVMDTSTHFLTRTLGGSCSQLHAPVALHPRKEPMVLTESGVNVPPDRVWTWWMLKRIKFLPGIDLLSCSLSLVTISAPSINLILIIKSKYFLLLYNNCFLIVKFVCKKLAALICEP